MKKLYIKSIFNLGLLLLYPMLLIVFIGWFIIPFTSVYLKEIIAFGMMTAVGYSLMFLIRFKKIYAPFLLVFYIMLSFLAIIKLSFYYHYKIKLSASALYVIFETNQVEAKDFLIQYFDLNVLLIICITFFPILLYWLNKKFKNWVRSIFSANYSLKPKVLYCVPVLIIIFSLYEIQTRFPTNNFFTVCYISYKNYKVTKALLTENISKPKSNFIKVENNINSPQTHIVIIGESTSRWHMELYGYKRKTNPNLSKLKDEISIFNNVISPNTHTMLALDKILTFSNYKNPYRKENTSVVQLANQSGFTTYWLSNQRPIGLNEAVSTQIGNAAKNKYFLASGSSIDYVFDGILLPKLDEILEDSEKKRIIFIHLAGTHLAYEKRYPKTYQYFDGETYNPELNTKQNQAINRYDNAVRYNDYIVSEIIQKVKAKNTNSYVVYFSDHGDEVYDTINFKGHNEYHGTKPMFDIPFIVWKSNAFNAQNKNRLDSTEIINRHYSLENFIYSFSDLTNISFKGYDSTKSIFNKHYKKHTRYILNDIDYDNR